MNLRGRIETLEAETPGVVTLILDDGSTRSFPGRKGLEFLAECEKQFRAGGGPLASLLMRAVDAKNCCGKIWRLMQCVWGPLEEHGIATPASPPEAAPIKAFKEPNSEDCPKN
jgi:hypothetical protein